MKIRGRYHSQVRIQWELTACDSHNSLRNHSLMTYRRERTVLGDGRNCKLQWEHRNRDLPQAVRKGGKIRWCKIVNIMKRRIKINCWLPLLRGEVCGIKWCLWIQSKMYFIHVILLWKPLSQDTKVFTWIWNPGKLSKHSVTITEYCPALLPIPNTHLAPRSELVARTVLRKRYSKRRNELIQRQLSWNVRGNTKKHDRSWELICDKKSEVWTGRFHVARGKGCSGADPLERSVGMDASPHQWGSGLLRDPHDAHPQALTQWLPWEFCGFFSWFPLSWWTKHHSRGLPPGILVPLAEPIAQNIHITGGFCWPHLPWTLGLGVMAESSPRFKSSAVQEELWLLRLLQNDRQHARELGWVSHFFLSQSDKIMAPSARRMSQMWSSACSAQGLPASPASDGGCRQHWPSTHPFSLGFPT